MLEFQLMLILQCIRPAQTVILWLLFKGYKNQIYKKKSIISLLKVPALTRTDILCVQLSQLSCETS